jgi:phage terminase large subunit GpA-like protein
LHSKNPSVQRDVDALCVDAGDFGVEDNLFFIFRHVYCGHPILPFKGAKWTSGEKVFEQPVDVTPKAVYVLSTAPWY